MIENYLFREGVATFMSIVISKIKIFLGMFSTLAPLRNWKKRLVKGMPILLHK
jgi:hypothetical protein